MVCQKVAHFLLINILIAHHILHRVSERHVGRSENLGWQVVI